MSITPEPDRSRPSSPDLTNICPECQARNPRRASVCWLCYGALRPDLPPEERRRRPPPHYEDAWDPVVFEAQQTRLSRITGALLSGLVLLASLGIFVQGDPEAILCGLLLLGAALPTLVYLFRPTEKVELEDSSFLGSSVVAGLNAIGIAFLVVVAAIVMFVATCFPIGLATYRRGGGGEMFAIAAGIVTASGVAFLVAWAFFRKRRPPQ